RGIVSGRELVIRRGAGGDVKGQRTDVYVFAVIPGQSPDDLDTASVIIEVKGSWHSDVLNAMDSQLVGEYLEQNQRTNHGLYVVGWYASPIWDPRDSRSKSARKLPS